MLTCDECKAHLNEYVYGEASFYLKAQMEEHLASCPACREEAAFLQQIRDTLSNMPKIEVDASFKATLNQKIDQLEQAAAPVKKRKFYKDWRAYSALAACVVLAVVLRANVFEFGKKIEQNGLEDRQAIANLDVSQMTPATPDAGAVTDMAATEAEPAAEPKKTAVTTPDVQQTAQPEKTAAPKASARPMETPNTQEQEPVETLSPTGRMAEPADVQHEPVQAANVFADEQTAYGEVSTEQGEDAAVYASEAPVAGSLKSSAERDTEEHALSGGARGGGGAASSGGSTMEAAAPHSAAPEKTQGSGILYVDAEHIAEARNIAGSYGTRSGSTVEMSGTQLKRYLGALREQGVEYHSSISDGDTVKFEIAEQ